MVKFRYNLLMESENIFYRIPIRYIHRKFLEVSYMYDCEPLQVHILQFHPLTSGSSELSSAKHNEQNEMPRFESFPFIEGRKKVVAGFHKLQEW